MNLKGIKRSDGLYAMGEWGSTWTPDRSLAFRFRYEDEARQSAVLHMGAHDVAVVDIDDGDRVLVSAARIGELREQYNAGRSFLDRV